MSSGLSVIALKWGRSGRDSEIFSGLIGAAEPSDLIFSATSDTDIATAFES